MNPQTERYILAMLYLKGDISLVDLQKNVAETKIRRGSERVPGKWEIEHILRHNPMVVRTKTSRGLRYQMVPEYQDEFFINKIKKEL